MADVIKTTFQVKRGTAARWEELNLILNPGEPGLEIDTFKLKIGDGSTPWKELPYVNDVDVQPDWNQNDNTQPDYVKNRPFYTGDTVEMVMLPETTITIRAGYENRISSSFPYSFELGKTYVITFDGVDTEYTAYEFEGSVVIGYDYPSISAGSGYVVITANGSAIVATMDTSLNGSHTIAIKRHTQEIIKIDEKYLPDNPINNITGARVGQIVKITAVDGSGKPTAWEAVDDRLPNASPSDVGKALYVEQTGEFEYGYGFANIPHMYDFINLDIDGASPGQLAKVKFVDDSGKPTAWEAVDMPSGGGEESDPTVPNWAKVNMTGSVGQLIAVSAVDDSGNVTAIAPMTIPNAEEASF